MDAIREWERIELEQRFRGKTLQQPLLESSERLDDKLAAKMKAWRPEEDMR